MGPYQVIKLSYIARIVRKLKKYLLSPRLNTTPTNLILKSFGSVYGGWVIAYSEALKSSTIISCGLGEDASFDVEMAQEFGLKVIFVDPTPRAIIHYNQIINRLGHGKTTDYSTGGAQLIDSYNLINLTESTFKLIPKAIWISDKPVRFYLPPIKEHVSHSILNYQNNYSSVTAYIEVEAISMKQLVVSESLGIIPLIKLDVEGAEIEVIGSFLNEGILPEQLLVEYDELSTPSLKGRRRIIFCHNLLVDHGYPLVNYSSPSNFLNVSKDAFSI